MLVKLSRFLVLLYFFLSPFYIFSNGSIQPADIILTLSVCALIVGSLISPKDSRNIQKQFKSNILFGTFVACTFLINVLYFLFVESDSRFLLSSFYFLFNFLAILVFSYFLEDKKFLVVLKNILSLNVIIQFVVLLTGVGKYMYDGARFMGTMGDPNMFCFYIFCCLLLVYAIGIKIGSRKADIVLWILGTFMVLYSASNGIILGIMIFVLARTILAFVSSHKTRLRILWIAFSLVMIGGAITFVFREQIATLTSDSLFFSRFTGKMDVVEGEASLSVWQDRGLDKIPYQPWYLLYGSGEGAYQRIDAPGGLEKSQEIHSVFPAIMFYYGIIPALIIIAWVYKKAKNTDPRMKCVLIALIIESFTLVNYRQPIFWLIILFASFVGSAKIKHERKLEYQNEIE